MQATLNGKPLPVEPPTVKRDAGGGRVLQVPTRFGVLEITLTAAEVAQIQNPKS